MAKRGRSFVITLIVIFSIIYSGNALRCYQCNSLENKACAEGPLPSSMIIECKLPPSPTTTTTKLPTTTTTDLPTTSTSTSTTTPKTTPTTSITSTTSLSSTSASTTIPTLRAKIACESVN
ncbi:PREDICTED: integumentary mucin C.1-like [Vollenhovia emeryi]|uniref:integumentary mucin C.1-like n=1 Tax=Vollenhovia emeryi TaxID=411798 RepID=UPI0005F4BC9D|nr:PREDICTED: integumentary mucin C.1-like [Vollenhovia emeryi]